MFKKSSGRRKSLRKMSTKSKLSPDVDTVLVPRNSPINAALGPQRIPNTNEPVFPTKCWHCENMAKNFLYLESLIRANFNEKCKCQTCSNSLKYLEFVNRNIKKYFGNFDSIVEVAKAFQGERTDDSEEPVEIIVKKPVKSKKRARNKSGEKSTKSTNENVASKTKSKKEEKKSSIKKSKSIKKVNVKNSTSKGKPKKKNVTRVVIKTAVPNSNTTIQH
ncbi:uncharacterized protein LOC119680847 [Teleopsis dalmanni]|uniref:uncharacterized protein LOC119680847 n=1 Tax=Teleopsis dalmanni TaxID=139649 RepID=UPI0018CF1C1A|nr:uncharacterized protein LOC119680847 [Teleopsis dalmanni]